MLNSDIGNRVAVFASKRFRRSGMFDEQIRMIGRLFADHGLAHWKSYAFSSACGGVIAACVGSVAYLIGHLVNEAYERRSFGALATVCLAIVAASLVKGIASYAQSIAVARTGNAITAEIQKRMIESVLSKGVAAFADRHTVAVANDINVASSSGANVLILLANIIGRDAFSVVALAAVVISQSPWLALTSIVSIPIGVFIVKSLNAGMRRAAVAQYEARRLALEVVNETLRGLSTIKAFTAEAQTRERVGRRIDEVKASADRGAHLMSRSRPLMDILGSVSTALVFFYGGYRVIAWGDLPGAYFSFTASFLLAYAPLKRLALVKLGMADSLQGLRVLYQFLDEASTEPQDAIGVGLTVAEGEIVVDNVDFAYRQGEPALRGLSFVAKPGQVTAVVGPSGSGKSTLIRLLLRLHQPTSGSIAIDGQDIAEVSLRSLRSQIGYVSQDVFLFSGTIKENIRLGSAEADEAAIIAAAKAAAAHEFIVALPMGYDTPAGEGGARFSTGQRQRISIARALLKNAPIVLLDEATASLDSESDRNVRGAIAELCRGRTTIVVAHRLNTIVEADTIHVMEAGRIVEFGTHEQMMRDGGRYASLYRSMFESMIGG